MTKHTASEQPKLDTNRNITKQALPGKSVTIAPDEFDAVLFDMDGIVTKTATIHAAAWKHIFDSFLKDRSPGNFHPFDILKDYEQYVDGKPRYDGVESFLAAREISLPRGEKDDPPGFASICALGNLKNEEFNRRLKTRHVEVYESTIALIQSLKKAQLKVAVITASENGVAVLEAANLLHIFDARVDGVDANRLGLKGKPAPDSFLEATKELRVSPKRAIVVEDAEAGVEAGRRGGFGLVIGVDRNGHAELLKQHGADRVVRDLAEVGLPGQTLDHPGMAIADMQISERNWVVRFDNFVSALEGRREVLCSLGNGYFVARAAAPESQADGVHAPGTYLAGVYNRLKFESDGIALEYEDLVNVPNWLCLNFRIEQGAWFDLEQVEIEAFEQALNMREGLLYRTVRFRDKDGHETTLAEKRFVHMRHPHLAGLETVITANNWSGLLSIRSGLDGRVLNIGTKLYDQFDKKHLQPVESNVEKAILYLKMKTSQSSILVAEAARTEVFLNGKPVELKRTNIMESNFVAQEMGTQLTQGDSMTLQKTVSLFSSRDPGITEPGQAARDAVVDAPGFDALVQEQIKTWRLLWRRFDLRLETDESIKMQISLLLHLNTFHSLQTASHNSIDLDIGMPARGWSEGYLGHVFWDDLFVFPFLNLRMPDITQTLLKYRFRRLDEARKSARAVGLPGARYPWQSGSNGREETPAFIWYPYRKEWVRDYSYLQLHVNASIALGIWLYYQTTGNLEFMHTCGAEMLIEIARFFAHYAHYNSRRGRYEIHGVVGPDEFHVAYPTADKPGLNNNAYTNVMAVWTLWRALDLLKVLPEDHCHELCERLNVTAEELELWDRVSRKMFVPITNDGIICQFEGYERLQEFPWRKDGNIDVEKLKELLKAQGGTLNQYQVAKQPDVLMLFFLFSAEELKELFDRLNYDFLDETIPKNIDFYVGRTANISTLSRVALSWVLSRADRGNAWELLSSISKKDTSGQSAPVVYPHSWEVFQEALGSDYFDIQGGTTAEGIHVGAMAGTVDIVQRCYTGIATRNDALWLNPCLPKEMTRLSFPLRYRHQSLQFEITQRIAKVRIGHSSANPIKIGFKDKVYEMRAGETKIFHIATGETLE